MSSARRSHLDRFYVERIQKARLDTDRMFHSLVSLQRLAAWGLGPVPSAQASKQFTDLLDKNYATGFKDFRLDAAENFPNLDFSAINLNLGAATSSLL